MTRKVLFTTQRLELVNFSTHHLDGLADMNADPEVMRYFPRTLNRAQSDALLARIMAHRRQYGFSLLALHLCEQETGKGGEFIGWCGLLHVDFHAHFTPAIEIGWRLKRAYWGQGLATEAARQVLAYGFETLGLPEIVSFTAKLNTRSERVMQRLGMMYQSADDFAHPKLPEDAPLCPHVLYRLPAGAFKTATGALQARANMTL
ncbi:MAG: GNAT family N-acetyltransferase [Parvibaculales bacterium]